MTGNGSGHSLTCHGVRVHAELAVVHRPLIQTRLQPLHHRGCGGQAKQTLRKDDGSSKTGEKKERSSGRSRNQPQSVSSNQHNQGKPPRLRKKVLTLSLLIIYV